MKNLITGAILFALLASTAAAEEPVTESRAWSESFAVTTATPHLVIENIWGNVRVRPGADGEITITVDEKRSAPNEKSFARSLELIPLNLTADTEGLSIIVGDQTREWRRQDPCHGCRADYQFDVLVPPGTIVDVGTVTDGQIDVAGVSGTVNARNVNGPVFVSGISACGIVESVNGELELSFAQSPSQNCNIETINGDISVTMPAGSGIDVELDLFNGRMMSDFSVDSYALPASVEHTTTGGKNRYRIQQSAGLRLENGGPIFSISSLNGDIQISKNQ